MKDKDSVIYLIDGHALCYRAFYAIRELTNSKGMPTNAIYGFITMLLKVVEEYKPDYMAVVFDTKEPTFRSEMYPEYKANRSAPPDDLILQIPYIKDFVSAFNFFQIEKR